MSYSESGIDTIAIRGFDGGVILTARNTHADKLVQVYVGGELRDWQQAIAERVEFHLAGVRETDDIRLLAVDVASSATDLFDVVWAATYGNRLRIRSPQRITPYLPSDKWRVYRGDAGDAEADTFVWEQQFYPGGARCGGFGFDFGSGGFGWDGSDAKGFGYNFGYGEFGFDCAMLEYVSETLPPGAYPVKVTVVDAAGNESTASEDTVTLDTYARPASGLMVESYDKATDALELSFTASEDIS